MLRGKWVTMSIGASIALIAVGAILKYAVNASVQGIEIATVGLILIIAGIIGLVISLILFANASRGGRGDVVERRRVYRDDV
jgi:Flp pilus assembly protein protease CpaA